MAKQSNGHLDFAALGAKAANKFLTEVQHGITVAGAGTIPIQQRYDAGGLGYQYGMTRDVYTALGYPKTIQFSDYLNRFERQGLAKRVVEMPAESCWHESPKVTDDLDPKSKTQFERSLDRFNRKYRLFNLLKKLDVVSGIGQFGILILGMRGQDLDTPLRPGRSPDDLLWMQVYNESHAQIARYDESERSERFGLPELYTVQALTGQTSTRALQVHHSRVLHVAEDPPVGSTFGTPRMKPVYNYLMDVEKLGAAAEGYWRNGVMGIALKIAPEFASYLQDEDLSEAREEAESFIHGFQRVLGTRGMDVQRIAPDLVDPRGTWAVLVQQISGTSGIPARMLLGSERGELASGQDERAWIERVQERRTQHVTPHIVEPMIDKLIEIGAITSPSTRAGKYEVVWEPLGDVEAESRSLQGQRYGTAIKAYADAEAASVPVVSRSELRTLLKLDPNEPDEVKADLEERKKLREQAAMPAPATENSDQDLTSTPE